LARHDPQKWLSFRSAPTLDHALTGDWAGHRECHVGGDFLLIYQLDDTGRRGLVVFVRAGTHADLFE
jgi:mRNA interferase YafQ